MTRIYVIMALLLFVALGLVGVYYAGAKHGAVATQRTEQKAAAKSLAENTTKQDNAEKAYADEVEELHSFNVARPVTAGRLCGRPESVPAAAADSGDAGAGAPTSILQPVPAADPGGAYDRPGLLGRLAELADEVSAQDRLWQAARAP